MSNTSQSNSVENYFNSPRTNLVTLVITVVVFSGSTNTLLNFDCGFSLRNVGKCVAVALLLYSAAVSFYKLFVSTETRFFLRKA